MFSIFFRRFHKNVSENIRNPFVNDFNENVPEAEALSQNSNYLLIFTRNRFGLNRRVYLPICLWSGSVKLEKCSL